MDLTITAVAVAAGFTVLGAAKVAKTPFMRVRAERVGFKAESYQLIGGAELAGAAGVLAGLVYPPAGYTAAIGLLALLSGAIVSHTRHGDGLSELAPAVLFSAGTVAYLFALVASR